MAKVVVIGAGIGGMCTAARLARLGHEVEIFEASDRTGGKCRTEWIGDYAFDTGPSLLTLPAVFKDFFLKTGMRLEKSLTITPVDPAFNYHFADGVIIDFPNLSLTKICDSIESALGKSAADEWHALMQRAETMWDLARGPFIESELGSIFSLILRKNFISDLMQISPLTSLRRYTKKFTQDSHLQMITERYATYTGSDPRKVPAVLLSIAFMETTFGAWHLKGGVGQLSQAIEERCIKLGVKIHLNTLVSEITVKSASASGVKLAGGRVVDSDIVVANADAELVYNKLLPFKLKQVNSERRKLKRATKSLAGFSLLLGLDNSKIDGDAPIMNHHSVYFPKDYGAEFNDIFLKKQPVADPTIYICSPNDSSMVARPGLENWSVLVNAPRHDPETGMDWNIGAAEYAKTIISKLDALGLRVSERLDVLEIRTPLDLQESVHAPGGSIYGTSSNGARSAFLRAKNRSPLPGLYCVGGSAHPGGGLPLVGISAELVAAAIGPA